METESILAPPDASFLRLRSESAAVDALGVRTVVGLRELTRSSVKGAPLPQTRTKQSEGMKAPEDSGRTVLATSATIYGGMLGYSLQRASGSDDPRLLYPLMAVGAGLGFGVSTLVSNEWNLVRLKLGTCRREPGGQPSQVISFMQAGLPTLLCRATRRPGGWALWLPWRASD